MHAFSQADGLDPHGAGVSKPPRTPRRRSRWSARYLAVVAALMAVVAVVPSAAFAAQDSYNISLTTSSPAWKHYGTLYDLNGSGVEFDPNNLLYQGGGAYRLHVRMTNSSDIVISGTAKEWSDYSTKTLHSSWTATFKLDACCYSSSGGDTSWGGVLSRKS